MRALLRVDAGTGIGLGHLTRCLALARALGERGGECFVLSAREVEARVRGQGLGFCEMGRAAPGSDGDLAETMRLAKELDCATVIVDSYQTDAAYLAQLRAQGLFVVMIDDPAAFAFPCQMVVNGSLYADRQRYVSATGDTEFLLGTRYILLRPEFWNVSPAPLRERVENVLVLLGGFDPLNLMPRLLEMLDGMRGDFRVTAVVGPFFENREEVEAAAHKASRRVDLRFNPPDVRDLMLSADAAISAGGQTIHELLVCGCPTLALAIAENQRVNVEAWAECGAVATVSGAEESIAPGEVAGVMQGMVDVFAERARLRERGRNLIDGQGAMRVAIRLMDALTV